MPTTVVAAATYATTGIRIEEGKMTVYPPEGWLYMHPSMATDDAAFQTLGLDAASAQEFIDYMNTNNIITSFYDTTNESGFSMASFFEKLGYCIGVGAVIALVVFLIGKVKKK